MSEYFGGEKKEQALKEIVRDLNEGTDIAKVRKRFASLIKDVSPQEIARMEQSLITEGVPVEKVQKMCDVHVAVFEETLKKQKREKTLPGHPIKTFVDENGEAKRRIKKVKAGIRAVSRSGNWDIVERDVKELKMIENHYLRKENLLFPLLEAEDFTGPSKVMWGKHDEIRTYFKELDSALTGEDHRRLKEAWGSLMRGIRRMIFMEERILFPTALRLLSDAQWAEIRRGESEIGYSWIEPGNLWDADIVAARAAADNLGKEPREASQPLSDEAVDKTDQIPLDVGAMTPEMINLLLKNLPLDVTYVDEHDRVRYYSQGRERIFPRTPAIIGREVQNCHPPKSVHVVEQIVDDFKQKKRDVAAFWLTMGEKFIHIRYFPLYTDSGEYRGVLEVSQDVTAIRSLEGEKRLLD